MDIKYHPDTKELYSGKVFTNFMGGKPKLEGSYKDGLMNGNWVSWYENGQKLYEGSYKDGLMNGDWVGWNENGQKLYEGKYKNGDGSDLDNTGVSRNGRDGIWTFWYENGNKISEENFKDGINHGLWTIWYDNGNKKSEWDYKDGELVNIIGSWNEDGSEKGKKQSVKTSKTEKIIYEERPFRVSYILHKYDEDIEVELILDNMGNKPYSIVWFNFRFYNGDEMVGSERISFISLGVFGEQTEIIDFDEEFDKIEVEFLKSK